MTGVDSMTTWLGASVALATGSALAIVASWRVLRGDSGDLTTGDDTAADYDERLANLIAQLRDLDEQAPRLAPDAYAAQKQEFEARAAAVMRERDAVARRKKTSDKTLKRPADVSPTIGFLAARPQLRGALWGGGTVGIACLLYTLVVAEQTPRAERGSPPMMAAGAPPAPEGGGSPMGGGIPPQSEGEVQALTEHLTKNPSDVSALLRLAHILLRAQMLKEASIVNNRALSLEPQNPEARVHAAVLRAGEGDASGALSDLGKIVAEQPRLAEAWFFRGMLGMQSGDKALMRDSFQHFIEVAPDGPQKQRIQAMLQSQAGP